MTRVYALSLSKVPEVGCDRQLRRTSLSSCNRRIGGIPAIRASTRMLFKPLEACIKMKPSCNAALPSDSRGASGVRVKNVKGN